MRIAFLGSPEFALPALNALYAAGHEIVCVYSQPPKPKGRGQKLQPTIIHARADELGIMVRTPKSLRNAEEQAAFAALELDFAIVVAYGLILPQEILDAPKFGCLNIHPSLLPRWRGAAPLQRCIEAGDSKTAIEIMAMDIGLDTGDIYIKEDLEILPSDTYGTLSEKCANIGARLLVEILPKIVSGELKPLPQIEDGLIYAQKITKEEARIDWTQPAKVIDCKIRGFSPLPCAWAMLDGARHKILMSELFDGKGNAGVALDDNLAIACGDGAIRILRLQREGKPAMNANDYLRAFPINKGAGFD
jgi:methionyl-tRNA formyltransferase